MRGPYYGGMQSQSMAMLIALGVGLVLACLVLLVLVSRGRFASRPAARPVDELDPTTEALLESIPMPAVVFGESLRQTYVNPAFVSSEDLVRRVRRQEWFQRALMTALLSGEATSRPASAEYPEDIYVMALPGKKIVAIVIDQTERYRTAAMREDFIANASHELNTPAAAISLLAEAIVKTAKKGSTTEVFSKSLVEEADRLTSLTRDIVRLSEVQEVSSSTDDDRNLQVFDAAQSVEYVVASHLSLADQVGVQIEYLQPISPGPFLVQGNKQWFEVAVGNLVENAIQYSPTGAPISVSVDVADDLVSVHVADQGPGVARELQEQIFQRFYRLDSARTRKAGGTGLGLSIVRNTARHMGGDATVVSQPGEGATFTLSVPATAEPLT